MTAHYFLPIGDTLATAWTKVKGSKGSFWAAIAIIVAIGIGLNILGYCVGTLSKGTEAFIQFVNNVLNFFLQMGVIYMGIKKAQDLPITYKNLFYPFRLDLILKLIGLYILKLLVLLPFGLVMVIAAALTATKTTVNADLSATDQVAASVISSSSLFSSGIATVIYIIVIIGVIFVSLRMILAAAYVLDKNAGPWQAILLSFKATQSNVLRLLGLFIVQGFIFLLGVITAGIGFIWIMPYAFIIYGLAYKRLSVNAPVI